MPRLITVTSGSDGVGRTSFVLNAGIALGKMDFKVLLVDADMGLSNLDVMMGIMPLKTLVDVIAGDANPENIIIKTGYKIDLIPASSGLRIIDVPDEDRVNCISKDLENITAKYDFIIADAPSGVSSRTLGFLSGAPEIVIAINNDDKSLTGSYALIKELRSNGENPRFSMFASMVKDYSAGHELFRKLSLVSQRFVNTHINYVGPVLLDDISIPAAGEHIPLIVKHPTSDTARCYRMITSTLLSQKEIETKTDKFFSRLIRLAAIDSNPSSVREVSFDEKVVNHGLERTMDAILEEQRRTRLLLERLVGMIDFNGANGTDKSA
ncbi:MAG TPA: AAA family ATPase [Desulfomonilia bacterium]|jgi:flagellar biosynthesis protein FlhG